MMNDLHKLKVRPATVCCAGQAALPDLVQPVALFAAGLAPAKGVDRPPQAKKLGPPF
jgi:hypothetical protein